MNWKSPQAGREAAVRRLSVLMQAVLLAGATAAADTVITVEEVIPCSVESADTDSVRLRMTGPRRRLGTTREAYEMTRQRRRALSTRDIYEILLSNSSRVAELAVRLPGLLVTLDSGKTIAPPNLLADAADSHRRDQHRNDSSRNVGYILIAIGGFFLLTKIAHIDMNFWPVILIIIGLILIFGAGQIFRRRQLNISKGDDFFEEVAIFGGGDKYINSNAFKGGKIVSIFGASKIDLTRAQLANGEAEMEIVSIFGGSTLIVPNDWNVKIEVFNIFGGYGDKRIRGQVDLCKTLIVKGVAIFGGGEIKSY